MASATLVTRIPNARNHQQGIMDRIGDWLVRLGEISSMSRAAQNFAALNALSDKDLAERGLQRSELLDLCFGTHHRA